MVGSEETDRQTNILKKSDPHYRLQKAHVTYIAAVICEGSAAQSEFQSRKRAGFQIQEMEYIKLGSSTALTRMVLSSLLTEGLKDAGCHVLVWQQRTPSTAANPRPERTNVPVSEPAFPSAITRGVDSFVLKWQRSA